MRLRSNAVIWLAKRQPAFTKRILWLFTRAYIPYIRASKQQEHWLVTHLAELLGYRIPAIATLANGMKLTVAWNDFVGRAIYEAGCYEQDTVALLQTLLKPGMVFLDVGAHVGQYTLTASRLVGPTGQVHSFEPDPNTFRWLSINVRRNKLANVRLNQVALFAEPGKRSLYLATPRDIGSNSLSQPANYAGTVCDVPCFTLDEYVALRRVRCVDVMKIDIEGAEYSMLQGAGGLLSRENKPLLIIEFEEARQKAFGSSCAKLAHLLRSYGYTLFRIADHPLQEYVEHPDDPPSLNILAVPQTKGLLLQAVSEARRMIVGHKRRSNMIPRAHDDVKEATK